MRQVVEIAQKKYNFATSTSVLSAIETDKNRVIDGELLLVLSDMYSYYYCIISQYVVVQQHFV